MKRLVFILGAFVCFASFAAAQETSDKKRAKEEKAARLEAQYRATLQLINSRKFLIEAEYFTGSSPFDFVRIDSLNATLQQGIGYGIGAVKGSVTLWKVTKNDKKRRISIHLGLRTTANAYNIFMEIDATGYTTVTFNSYDSLKGYVKPVSESTMYRATPI